MTKKRRTAKQRGKREPLGKVFRGQSAPPVSLAEFIKLVNADKLYDHELPDIYGPFYVQNANPSNASIPRRNIWVKVCRDAADSLSEDTRKFLGPPEELDHFLANYAVLESARDLLLGLADYHREKEAGEVQPRVITVADSRFQGRFPFEATVKLSVDKDGNLVVLQQPLLEAVKGVRADRIRACKADGVESPHKPCGRIFWATRDNSYFCSRQCGNRYNQQQYRKEVQPMKSHKGER